MPHGIVPINFDHMHNQSSWLREKPDFNDRVITMVASFAPLPNHSINVVNQSFVINLQMHNLHFLCHGNPIWGWCVRLV
jgi:hypothetical protein